MRQSSGHYGNVKLSHQNKLRLLSHWMKTLTSRYEFRLLDLDSLSEHSIIQPPCHGVKSSMVNMLKGERERLSGFKF